MAPCLRHRCVLVGAAIALALSALLAGAEPVLADGATPLADCTVDQNPPFIGGAEAADLPCASNLGLDLQTRVPYIARTHRITNGGIFTPGADAPQRIRFEALNQVFPSGPENYHPIWADCFGDACNLGNVPNPALMRTRDGSDPFAGLFRRNGAYGWQMKMVTGQPSNCFSQLQCDYDLVFTNGFQDASGIHIPTLAKDQQAVIVTGGGQISIAFNRRVGGPPPTAAFVVTPLGGRTFRFDASTSLGAGLRYEWKFGDGETLESTQPIVEHTYEAPGKYLATLRVIDANNNPSVPFVVEVDVKGILVNSIEDRPRLAGTTGCDTGEDVPGGAPECTLRAAIQALNLGVADTIEFALPAGAGSIEPASNLPDVTAAGATIDGDTQPSGEVVLAGRGIRVVDADHVTIKGLTILGGDVAVQFGNSPDGLVVGNSIGVDAGGTINVPLVGVEVIRSPRLRIGGPGTERNVIGADDLGIVVFSADTGADSDDVVVRGNLIGIDGAGHLLERSVAGVHALARSTSAAARRLLIEGNTIAGAETNVLLLGHLVDGAIVRGNRLGTNAAGTSAVGQTLQNLRADEVPNLTVRNNDASGASFDIVVAGSIQTSTVTTPDGKQHFNFRIPGDSAPDKPREGINAVVADNRVGLVGPRPDASSGIALFAGVIDATVAGNTVGGHGGEELSVREAERAVIRDNTVGIDVPSTALGGIRVIGSERVEVSGNLIGALATGLAVGSTKGVTITNNVVGLGTDGVTAKSVTTGISLFDGNVTDAVIGPDNTLANASAAGIATSAASVKIFKNKIGIARFGSTAAPNGIGINVLAGKADIHDNTIANSATAGVNVATSDPVTLRSNSIYNTTAATSGIKGAPAAPTVTGAARVTSGASTRTWLVVTGLPETGEGVIEVFGNPSCTDPEGKVPLFHRAPEPERSTRVFNVIGRADLHGLTVTYTGSDGKTSVFSSCATPAEMPDTDGDGIPDIVEAAAPVRSDFSDEAASLVSDNDKWIALVVPPGYIIADFRLLDDPDPNGHPGKFFPFGFFTFTITNVPIGELVPATLVLPASPPVTAWWKHAPPEPGDPSSLWNFTRDLQSGTGAFVTRDDSGPYGEHQQLHLSIVDGGRGDEDFIANGSVRDPGAPSACGDDDSFESVACRLDSFRCYQAKPAKRSPKFAPVLGVRANGTFDDVLVDVKKPLQLCVPADTTGEGVLDAQTHLEAYAIKLQKGQSKPVPQKGRQITSQLGPMVVDTAKAAQLLLPTAEDPVSAPALTVNLLDRFTCYPVKLAKGQPKLSKDLQLTVGDQFTDPPKRVRVKKLVRLCTPTGANGAAAKQNGHLLCVQVAASKGRCDATAPTNAGGACKSEPECGGTKGQTQLCGAQEKFVKQPNRNVANELHAGTLDAAKEDVLCLPAVLAP